MNVMSKSNCNIVIFAAAGDQPAADGAVTCMNLHQQQVWMRCSQHKTRGQQ